jgi:hypothetical protein
LKRICCGSLQIFAFLDLEKKITPVSWSNADQHQLFCKLIEEHSCIQPFLVCGIVEEVLHQQSGSSQNCKQPAKQICACIVLFDQMEVWNDQNRCNYNPHREKNESVIKPE